VVLAVAGVVPLAPLAVAVYTVVAVGLTACVPPVTASVYETPPGAVTVTVVALVAVTVSVDEFPEAIDAGFAVMVTVGAGFAVTVTVAVAVIVPPGPVAVAVYVVVVVGLTDWIPPFPISVYETPPGAVTVTLVEFVAVTVNVDEVPEVIDCGDAAIVTVGAGFEVIVTVAVAVTFPPVPDAVAV